MTHSPNVLRAFCLLLALWLAAPTTPVRAQINPAADLTLQNKISSDYILDLTAKDIAWKVKVAFGGNTEATMKAHMGLAFLAFAWSHVDADTLDFDITPVFDDMNDDWQNLLTQIDDYILPILLAENIDSMFTELIDLFQSGDYELFRDSLSFYGDNIELGFRNADDLLQNWFDDFDENFSDINYQSHLDFISDNTAEFEFALQVIGGGYEDSLFVFDRALFNHFDSLEVISLAMDNAFEGAGNQFDAVMDIVGGDVSLAVDSLRLAFGKMAEAVDTIKVILTSDPLAPFEIDTEVLDSLSSVLGEIDALLGGKVYEFGPTAEAKTIIPLEIIKNMPGDGLDLLLHDFYRAADPTTYTFGGIFPAGMPVDGLAWVLPDAVFHDADDEEMLYDRLQTLEASWVNNTEASDLQFGLAMILFYETIHDNAEILEEAFRFLEEGRLDSLAYTYAWSDIDILSDLDDVLWHLENYTDDATANINFVVLIKTNVDELDKYSIGPNSEFEVIMIPAPVAAVARLPLVVAVESLNFAVSSVQSLYNELDDLMDLNLDPTVLDFSTVDSDSELVILLETSNPQFLTLTPYGIQQFIQTGEDLEEAFKNLDNFFAHMADLANAIAPYERDFDIDGKTFIDDMKATSEAMHDLYIDFKFPDSTITIDGERVNLSAWFDDPPWSFLILWKNYIFGVDSTLAGLFPDRYTSIIAVELPGPLPTKLTLQQNYPNPFNPTTKVVFDLPKQGFVELTVYDLLGNEVDRLVNKEMPAGRQTISWRAASLPAGIYFLRLRYRGDTRVTKMTLMK